MSITAGSRKGYTQYVHTAAGRMGERIHTACPMSILVAVDRDTPCMFLLVVVERIHPACPYCWRWKGIHPSHPYCWLWKDTPCTSILLAVESDTPSTSRRLPMVLFLLYDVEKSLVNV
jgi:hypothetical protein